MQKSLISKMAMKPAVSPARRQLSLGSIFIARTLSSSNSLNKKLPKDEKTPTFSGLMSDYDKS